MLTRAEVLKRLRAGDLPTTAGGYTSTVVFADHRKASHATITKLHRDGLIERPEHHSIYSPWTLTEAGAR